VSFYQPLSETSAPLQPGSEGLAIGYGSAGGQVPRVFWLPPGQNVDITYLKIFLSTRYVNYSNIPQSSPFSEKYRYSRKALIKTPEVWDTFMIRIIQKRGVVGMD
jgi:hypothetical protein